MHVQKLITKIHRYLKCYIESSLPFERNELAMLEWKILQQKQKWGVLCLLEYFNTIIYFPSIIIGSRRRFAISWNLLESLEFVECLCNLIHSLPIDIIKSTILSIKIQQLRAWNPPRAHRWWLLCSHWILCCWVNNPRGYHIQCSLLVSFRIVSLKKYSRLSILLKTNARFPQRLSINMRKINNSLSIQCNNKKQWKCRTCKHIH